MSEDNLSDLLRSPESRSNRSTALRMAAVIVAVAAVGLAVVLLVRGGEPASVEPPQEADGVDGVESSLPAESQSYPDDAAATSLGETAVFPDARSHAQAAVDPINGVFVLFGGQPGIGAPLEGTWLFDLEVASWSVAAGAAEEPSPRSGHAMTYVDSLGSVLMYGGGLGGYRVGGCATSNCPTGLAADTWLFDAATASWTNLDPGGGPDPRYGHAVAYDSESDRVVLFGGVGTVAPDESVFLDDTWAFDPVTNTWEEIKTETSPAARSFSQLTYNQETDLIYMFGGMAGRTDADAELWTFDVDTGEWELIDTGTGPTPRWMHQMDLDVGSGNLYVYGGHMRVRSPQTGEVTVAVEYSDEAWIFDPTTGSWQEAVSLPWQVFGHASESTTDGIVAWLVSDLYHYDTTTGTWAKLTEPE